MLAIGNITLGQMQSMPPQSAVLVSEGGSGTNSRLLIDRNGDPIADEAITRVGIAASQFSGQDFDFAPCSAFCIWPQGFLHADARCCTRLHGPALDRAGPGPHPPRMA